MRDSSDLILTFIEEELPLDDLTDDEWEILRDLIPKANSSSCTMNAIVRSNVNAILWRMRTGEPWRFVPSHYGNSTSVFRRFQNWKETGVWESVTSLLAEMRPADHQFARRAALEIRKTPSVHPARQSVPNERAPVPKSTALE